MSYKINIFFLLFISNLSYALNTVNDLDLGKYQGLWHEIYRMPNSFQQSCNSNVTAHYSLEKNYKLKVTNKCKYNNGKYKVATGVAKYNKLQPGKLKVSFVSILGFNLFWGNYWILDLAKDYSYVIIGEPNLKYAWILSRTKTLPDKLEKKLITKLQQYGYDTNKLIKTKISAN